MEVPSAHNAKMDTKRNTNAGQITEEVTFGTWLRQRRRALDLTQEALADQVGCARITLRRIEADELKPGRARAGS